MTDLLQRRSQRLGMILLATLSSILWEGSFANQLYTFDNCNHTKQCASELSCLQPSNGTISLCLKPDDGDCLCLPNAFRFCARSKLCRFGEGCATNPRTGSQLCVSCNLINEDSPTYEQVDPNSNKCTPSKLIPTPSPIPLRPPKPQRTFDYCSVHIPCGSGLSCVEPTLELKECNENSSACNCFPEDVVMCDSHKDCPTADACVRFSYNNDTRCVSCNILKKNRFFIPVSRPLRCARVEPVPLPKYKPPGNGQTFDLCTSDLQCDHPRKCRLPTPTRKVTCKNNGVQLCYCLKPDVDKCNKSSDCESPGELCALLNIAERKECYSSTFLSSLRDDEYLQFGKKLSAFRTESATGLTGAPCRYDWDCARGRLCTHHDDRFGGCAGRRACFCQPIFRKVCMLNSGCQDGEGCMNYPGASSYPFCFSRENRQNERFLRMVGYKSEDPLPDISVKSRGLISDPCRTSPDCQGTRVCSHITEGSQVHCGGRDFCICTVPEQEGNMCQSKAECGKGEVCTKVKDSLFMNNSCISAQVLRKQKNAVLEKVM